MFVEATRAAVAQPVHVVPVTSGAIVRYGPTAYLTEDVK
jgi:hypothetical protein